MGSTEGSITRKALIIGGGVAGIQAALDIADAGYEVIIFEGPGQGGARIKNRLHMTHEWEKPMKVVLDFLG